jgi:suppressor for copper-sensitivity B
MQLFVPFLRHVALLLIIAAAAIQPARAEDLASDWGTTPQGRVRLLADPGAAGAWRLGLQFRLQPGWKIYWRSPGDAGLPPEIDWAGSTNVALGEMRWPVPDRFSFAGLETFGYEGEALFPIAASLPHPGEAAAIRAAVDFLTCRELCVPNHADLALTLPAGATAPGPWRDLIDHADRLVPPDGAAAGVTVTRVTAGTDGKDGVLTLTLEANPPLGRPDVLVEGAGSLGFLAPVAAPDGQLRLVATDNAAAVAALAGKKLSFTVIDRSSPADAPRAATVTATASAAPPAPGGLLPILALALLGGFILNFMPCVLPVLSIKLIAMVGAGEKSRAALRLGFLASASGIVASFLLLAVALVAARAAGATIGWGIQFQQPVFLAALAALVTLFACNLLGWFEIVLPWRLAALARPGGPSLAGSFASGVFATLLATPCSAPFLGTAVGFALAGSAVDILAVFLCLGIGLAAPYLAVALFPAIGRLMPRPGYWMLTLRRILGLMLAGTAGWLILVLAQQAGKTAALLTLGLALAAAASLALGHFRSGIDRATGRAAALLLVAMLVPASLLSAAPEAAVAEAGWAPFDPARVAREVAEGHVVFVDVTASWCLTCQANERFVLDSATVHGALSGPGIVALRADWTRPDAQIARYLHGFGRYGIPFNAVYGPAEPDGETLPELLTDATVLDALRRAGARS